MYTLTDHSAARTSNLPATVDVALQQDIDTGNDHEDEVAVPGVVPDNEFDVVPTSGDGGELSYLCCRNTCIASLSTDGSTKPL